MRWGLLLTCTCFNSLQTGRSMESVPLESAPRPHRFWVSIPFKREGAWKDIIYSLASVKLLFQFPSNGKEHGKRPYFRPRRAVASNTPKPNTNCARLFFSENLPRKSHKPLWPLNQTRFFNKITLKVRPHLRSWANYAVLVSDP